MKQMSAETQRELVEALDEIVNPIKYMRMRAEAEGAQLSGWAHSIANNAEHLRQIARVVLAKARAEMGEGGE